ncbi:ABC transporter permease subunit [Paenibacillus sp. LMG 31458]|uniref:ABC transporter permease subunit n=1 Tax=Paenibacillus phytorum TaxID=2654977 RepID=A0ABX1XZQ6_9BACL|nr:carbohydrate ABC transporter permease [Paenibacillus phytorum]NOU74062.1 ABC transporter permease subunit [Paenibacillus phytorum]
MNTKIHQRKSVQTGFIHLILILGAVIMVTPFIWMFLTSVKTLGESTAIPPVLLPKTFQWSNYTKVFVNLPFFTFYWNTFITTLVKVIGQLIICSLAAYAFARINFPGRHFFFILMLSVLMVPGQVFLIPQYMIMKDLGWLNSLTALIVPGLFSAFGTFLLRQFFMTLPHELEEAAKLDGCNQFRIYWQIMLPLAKSGMIALAIFTMLWSWNDLMWPLIVNSSPDKMVLSAGIAFLQGEHKTNYTIIMAGSMMAILPMIIIFFIFQRSFIQGIAFTGSKS